MRRRRSSTTVPTSRRARPPRPSSTTSRRSTRTRTDRARPRAWARRTATGAGAFAGNPSALLDDLTLPQRAAVEHRGGPLLIVAGAGSGKTRVLTRRIAHLLATGDAPPWGILAITFTNKAADEMRTRVADLVGPAAEKMWVSTFHSACLRMLRSNADRLGFRSGFTVYDDTDSRRLVEVITAELGFDQKRLPARAVQGVISQAKSELVDFETFREEARGGSDPFRKRIADVYAQYQDRLHAANALDFDDLLMITANLLQGFDDVRAAYQERFQHILVDEFQDTNHAQNEIVKLLGQAHGNVCVVGDSDQSVYRWRGADIRNILEFERAFPEVTTILLEQNFRSTQTILDAANAVIANNIGRQPKELYTVGDSGGPVKRYRAEDERDEASWVSSEILRLHASEGLAWGDVAVFYRTNAQSLPLETSMKFSGIPYKVVGGAASTTAARSRTCWPTSGCSPTPTTRSRPGGSSTSPNAASATPPWPAGGLGTGQRGRLHRGDRPGRGSRSLRQGAQGGAAAVEVAGRIATAGPDGQSGRLRAARCRPHWLPGRASGRAHPRGGRAH